MGEHTESSVLGYLIPLYPPLIARKAVKWFTGGGLSPKTLANDDKLGRGPRQRQLIGPAPFRAWPGRTGADSLPLPRRWNGRAVP